MAIKRIWEKHIDTETALKIRGGLDKDGDHKIVVYLSSEFGRNTFISLCVGYECDRDGMTYTHAATPKHSMPLSARINGRVNPVRTKEIIRESLSTDIERAKLAGVIGDHPYFLAMQEYLGTLG